MMDWLPLIIYVAGFLFSWWYIAPLIAESFTSKYDLEVEWEDRVFGSILAGMVAFVWPVALIAIGVASRQRKTPAARKRELDQQAKRIADLEYELGLKRQR